MTDLPEPLPAILKQVSRSFALSLGILPKTLRRPLGLAYLLARAADTIADTRILPQVDRVGHLDRLQADLDAPAPRYLADLTNALTGPQRIPAERDLLLHLPACFAVLAELADDDRARIRRVLGLLIHGMQADLRAFPGEGADGLASLETREDLDRYTYYAAGCVGEFWTDMTMAHRRACRRWDPDTMRRRGARFGQALQMTNVLRDLAQDLRIGRCYLPRQELAALHVAPKDLLQPDVITRVRPLLDDLLANALDDFDAALAYTCEVPRTEMRLRLACAWPMFIGLQTLQRLREANDLLNPAVTTKVPRAAVYRILARSGALAWSDTWLAGQYRALRRPFADLAAPRTTR